MKFVAIALQFMTGMGAAKIIYQREIVQSHKNNTWRGV